MKTIKKHTLTEGNIEKAILYFVLPLVLGSLIQQLYITTDAVIVGQYVGKSGLAAIDSVHTLFKFPINFMNGLSTGATILIAGYYGAGDRKNLHCSVRTAITVAVLLGTVCAAAGFLWIPALLNLMEVPKEIYAQTRQYCQIYFASIWAMILYNMAAAVLRAMGKPSKPLYILLFCSLLNIVLDFLFVKEIHLGVSGAALATALAQIFSMVLMLKAIAKQEKEFGQKKIWHLHFCKEHMWMMVKKGFPLAVQSMMFPIANSIVQAGVNQMGTNAIAAWGVCDKMDMLIWLIADAMGPAMTAYVAQNLGARKTKRIKRGIVSGVFLSVTSVVVISIVLYFWPGRIGSWFLNSGDREQIIPLIVNYMQMMAPFFAFYAVSETFSGICCGIGATFEAMLTTMITICLLRVIGIWICLPRYHNMECIIWIYIASWIASCVGFAGLFIKKENSGDSRS